MHPYLFFIGDFPVRAYGLILSLSIVLATGTAYFLAKADGRGYEKYIVDLGIYCGIAGLFGARLFDVFFFDWDYYSHHLTELLNVVPSPSRRPRPSASSPAVFTRVTKGAMSSTFSTSSRPRSFSGRHWGARPTS